MLERISRFIKNFFSALGRCFIENAFDITDLSGEGLGGVLGTAVSTLQGIAVIATFCACIACVAYGVFQITYELMFDPNAADVASRLAGISISPEKWI